VPGAPDPVSDDPREGEASELADGRVRLPNELLTMHMSFDRAQSLVGWKPQISLREGLQREWEWLQDNADRWIEMSY
jgi:nucleoside-diphosphate-sugar epimerase